MTAKSNRSSNADILLVKEESDQQSKTELNNKHSYSRNKTFKMTAGDKKPKTSNLNKTVKNQGKN